MLTEIRLKRPENKQQECELLERIAELVAGDTYLAELFTPEMVSDIQGRMMNDFPCNLYKDYRDRAADYDRLENKLQGIINQMQGTIDHLTNLNNGLTERIEGLSERFNQANDTGLAQLAEIQTLQQALSDREMECVQLKAKLWDLSNK